MVNQDMYRLGSEPNAMRALFAYGLERKAEIGDDKVFDFSLGNPSIPAPDSVRNTIIDLMNVPAAKLHGYTPAQGAPSVRKAIADSINRRFDAQATPNHIYLTIGAAASLSISLKALSKTGDEFIVIPPYFPEYKVWIETIGCTCVEVPARESDFQLDIEALSKAITSKTRGIIINSPNNPVGVVYSQENLEQLSDLLKHKQQEYSSDIYIISDEPYREVVYDGVEVPFVPSIYNNTLVCYSYSKSLSLPGERIGYLYVSEKMQDAEEVYTAVCGAGRSLGYVCAPALFQYVIEKCVDEPTNVEAYAENRRVFTEGLSKLGYEYIEPQGAFYLWVKSLEPDAAAFSEKAKKHELLLVASDSFGCSGWVRIGYCVDKETIINSMPAFEALKKEYE